MWDHLATAAAPRCFCRGGDRGLCTLAAAKSICALSSSFCAAASSALAGIDGDSVLPKCSPLWAIPVITTDGRSPCRIYRREQRSDSAVRLLICEPGRVRVLPRVRSAHMATKITVRSCVLHTDDDAILLGLVRTVVRASSVTGWTLPSPPSLTDHQAPFACELDPSWPSSWPGSMYFRHAAWLSQRLSPGRCPAQPTIFFSPTDI